MRMISKSSAACMLTFHPQFDFTIEEPSEDPVRPRPSKLSFAIAIAPGVTGKSAAWTCGRHRAMWNMPLDP